MYFIAMLGLLGRLTALSRAASILENYLNINALYPHLESYRLDAFPLNKTSLHMPCLESNVFATNCACHIRCTHHNCRHAWEVCERYRLSKGCRYVLFRGGVNNRIATLKRVPTEEEEQRFSVEGYPTTSEALGYLTSEQFGNTSGHWPRRKEKEKQKAEKLLSDLLQEGGDAAKAAVKSVRTQANLEPSLCSAGNSSMGRNRNTVGDIRSGNKNTVIVRSESDFLKGGISLVCLNYRTPKTLINSLRTWNSSGLLHLVAQRIAILNDPYPNEIAMAADFGFEILQPDGIQDGQLGKPNVLTIGGAFYYALQHVSYEYVLFLESDFKMDVDLLKDQIIFQLIGAASMLYNGAEVVRLQSKKGQGCGTFKSCDHTGIHLNSSNPSERLRNWYSFYCDRSQDVTHRVDTCMFAHDDPNKRAFRCFTSGDSNWSLNAAMVKRSTMLDTTYSTEHGDLSIADIGLKSSGSQDGFEASMIQQYWWMGWRVPVCISYDGMFIHEEIETSA